MTDVALRSISYFNILSKYLLGVCREPGSQLGLLSTTDKADVWISAPGSSAPYTVEAMELQEDNSNACLGVAQLEQHLGSSIIPTVHPGNLQFSEVLIRWAELVKRENSSRQIALGQGPHLVFWLGYKLMQSKVKMTRDHPLTVEPL